MSKGSGPKPWGLLVVVFAGCGPAIALLPEGVDPLACDAGVCAVHHCPAANGCDDGNPCTDDSCDDTTGCVHAATACAAPADPCQAAFCDPSSGCGTQVVADGTSCAPDQCSSAQQHVCDHGSCVERPRSAPASCPGVWSHPFMLTRYVPAMAYDSDRQRVVMFGGANIVPINETWEWDGSYWTQRFPAHTPASTVGGAMVYDPVRKRTVLFGGWTADGDAEVAETWVWNGQDWSQLSTAHAPSARALAAATFDSNRGVVTLFGGLQGPYAKQVQLADTWEFDGTDWTLRANGNLPGAASGNQLAHDALHQTTVLYRQGETWLWDGAEWAPAAITSPPEVDSIYYDEQLQQVVGYGSGGIWEFDGASWHQTSSAVVDSYFAGTAYDQAHQVVVGLKPSNAETWVFNGRIWTLRVPAQLPRMLRATMLTADDRPLLIGYPIDAQGGGTLAMLEWTGDHWNQVIQPNAPSARIPSVAYDSRRGMVVMFGGSDDPYGYGTTLDQTWEWDGSSWAMRVSDHTPAPRTDASLAYDAARGVTVMFGGWSNGATLADTWEWDGHDWTDRSALGGPAARAGAALGFDRSHGQIVLLGGWSYSSGDLKTTWTWDGQSWTEQHPATTPPTGERQSLAYDSRRDKLMLMGGMAAPLWRAWVWDGANWQADTEPPQLVASQGLYSFAYDTLHDQFVGMGDSDSYGTTDTWIYSPR